MAKKIKNQTISIILLVCLALLWVPIPFIDGKVISSIAILILSIYLFIK